MTAFDTLAKLEAYLPAFPGIARVISVMDRSLPYSQEDGSYTVPEDASVTYTVRSAHTSRNGVPFEVPEGSVSLLVALDGQEIVSSLDHSQAYVLSEGRFLLVGPGQWRRGVGEGPAEAYREVKFTFPA